MIGLVVWICYNRKYTWADLCRAQVVVREVSNRKDRMMSTMRKLGLCRAGLVLALSVKMAFAASGDIPWRYDTTERTVVVPEGIESNEFDALEMRTHTWNDDSYISPWGLSVLIACCMPNF